MKSTEQKKEKISFFFLFNYPRGKRNEFYLFLKSFFLVKVAFFGLYSLASLFIKEFFVGCRGGFGGGGERVLFINLSDFDIDTEDEDRNKTVFKLEFLFNDNVFVVEAGNVDEPFVGRRFRRLETLNEK